MKHAIAVAVLNAFTNAVSFAVNEGTLTHAEADLLMARSGEYTRKLLLGKAVMDHYLTDYQEDSDHYEIFHKDHPEAKEIEAHE